MARETWDGIQRSLKVMVRIQVLLGIVICLAGCSTLPPSAGGRAEPIDDKLVGTWKGDLIPGDGNPGFAKTVTTSILSPVLLEFNHQGRYKITLGQSAGAKGRFESKGGEIVLTPDDPKNEVLILDWKGDKLEQKRAFKSDDGFVVSKISSDQPS